MAIKIKPENKGLLHKKMGVPQGQKIPTDRLEADKAAAKNRGDSARVKQDTFAINARGWKK